MLILVFHISLSPFFVWFRWVAASGQVSLNGMILPAALYFWQIPHFMALAYLCRNDYAAGGYVHMAVFGILDLSVPLCPYRGNQSHIRIASVLSAHISISTGFVEKLCA